MNPVERPAEAVPAAEKVAWLRELDDAARSFSPEVAQVVGVYGDSLQRVLIATSDGLWVEESRPRIRLVAQVVAARDDNIQTGFHGPAACSGVEFVDRHPPRATAEIAARRAVTMLDSIPAPAGEMTVVLAPGMGGVLFHEAVGHPLESDADRQGGQRLPRAGRRAVRVRADRRRRRRDGPERLGLVRVRRRGHAVAAHRAVRRRACCRACSTTGCAPTRTGSRPRATAGAQSYASPADPADDEHVHPERRVEGRRHPVVHRERRVRHVARRRPGESGDRRLRVRRQRGVPDRGRRGRPRRSAART